MTYGGSAKGMLRKLVTSPFVLPRTVAWSSRTVGGATPGPQRAENGAKDRTRGSRPLKSEGNISEQIEGLGPR